GTGTHVDGQIRLFGADLRELPREASDSSEFGSGRVTARIDFAGTDVQSFDDLTATVDASFSETQAMQMLVLRQLAPYLSPGLSRSSTFQSGDLRARLDRGILRIQRLGLVGRYSQMLIEGNVTVDTGRLDLRVLANTGQLGPNQRGLALLGLHIPVVGPIPVGLLVGATDYLPNRVLHLRVTGTYRSPTIQVEPVPLLTEEALRFFVNRAVPINP